MSIDSSRLEALGRQLGVEVPPAPGGDATNEDSLLEAFSEAIVETRQLVSMEIPPKQGVLGEFFCEGDLGIIYAPRGLGKTWLTSVMANAIATGCSCGEWSAGKRARKVLVVDGEMALAQTQERAVSLRMDSENLFWLHHERLFQMTEKCVNIADASHQEALTRLIVESGVEVVFLDNLSTLALGVAENQSDDWEKVGPWLLRLRRHNVSVVVIAHAGKNGNLRGTSRREDALNWILKLEASDEDGGAAAGARFKSHLEKNRNSTPDLCPQLEWTFQRGDPVTFQCNRCGSRIDRLVELVNQGIDRNKDIAELLGVTPGAVSKMATAARNGGQIKTLGRRYLPVS